MKKTKTILLFILTTFLNSCSDNENDISPPIEGDVHLKNQQEVNEFGANNYSGINGNLTIGYQSGVRDITNLNPLSSLSFIDGNLDINYNDNLASLNGLNNIESINGFLHIGDNNSLANLNGLSNLNSVVATLNLCSVIVIAKESVGILRGNFRFLF